MPDFRLRVEASSAATSLSALQTPGVYPLPRLSPITGPHTCTEVAALTVGHGKLAGSSGAPQNLDSRLNLTRPPSYRAKETAGSRFDTRRSMPGIGRPVSDRSSSQSLTPEPRWPWGCAPSTSYSTSNVGLPPSTAKLPRRSPIHNLTFSLQLDRLNTSNVPTMLQPTRASKTHAKGPTLSFGSISFSLPCTKPESQKHKQTVPQGICFEVSELRPSLSQSQKGNTPSAVRRRSSINHANAAPSYSLDTFQLSDISPTHTQQTLFASLSSVPSTQPRKRKAPSVASDRSSMSAACQSHRQAGVQHVPLMTLAQNAAKAISREADEGQDEGPSLASAGRKLRKSALVFPSNIRRLVAGAFAGALSFLV